jgi:predicted ribosomally synthesized peptide with SipW-like signal peptide
MITMTDDNKIALSRRKVLGSIGAIGVASAGAGLGTSAYFSDDETLDNNAIQAGELDLEIGSNSSVPLGISGVAPGDSGSASVTIENTGNIGGRLTAAVNITGYNTNNAGDNEPHYSQSGELRDEIQISVGFDGTGIGFDRAIKWGSIGTADLQQEVPAYAQLDGGNTGNLVIEWQLDEDATNEVQTDEIQFEVVVSLKQAPPVTVGNTSELRSALDNAAPGDVIRLADQNFNIDSTITVDTPAVALQPQHGASPTITSNSGHSGNAVDIQANDVLFSGIDINKNSTSGKAIQINGNIKGTKTDPGVTGVTVSHLTVKNSADQRGVSAGQCGEIVYKGVSAENNGNDGVTLWYTHDSRIDGVTAVDNGDNGIYVNGADCKVLNCEVSGSSDQGLDFSIYDEVTTTLDSANRMLVDNVYAHDNANAGIELHDNGTDQTDAENTKLVKNCRTENNDWDSQSSIDSAGLVLNQVKEEEVQLVNSYFSEGTYTATGTDLD